MALFDQSELRPKPASEVRKGDPLCDPGSRPGFDDQPRSSSTKGVSLRSPTRTPTGSNGLSSRGFRVGVGAGSAATVGAGAPPERGLEPPRRPSLCAPRYGASGGKATLRALASGFGFAGGSAAAPAVETADGCASTPFSPRSSAASSCAHAAPANRPAVIANAAQPRRANRRER